MEDLGQFLFLLAFVIIAAIQWVIKQIQERNAPPESDEDPFEDTWRELEEQREERSFQEGDEAPQVRREQEPPQSPPAANPLGELRNLFEALKQRDAPVEVEAPPRKEKAPVVVSQASPPPPSFQAKSLKVQDAKNAMSEAERAASQRFEARERSARSSHGQNRPNDGNFRKFLRGSGNLRQALILKEVFDRPLGLRHENQEESMRG